MGSAGTPEHAANLCEAQNTGLQQATDERVNSAIPHVFASNSVVQHPLHPSDVVDTIGQPAHSRTDPLGHVATAAYVGTSIWLVMKPVGAHRPTCETPPPPSV